MMSVIMMSVIMMSVIFMTAMAPKMHQLKVYIDASVPLGTYLLFCQ
jgi:hypothetical protein